MLEPGTLLKGAPAYVYGAIGPLTCPCDFQVDIVCYTEPRG